MSHEPSKHPTRGVESGPWSWTVTWGVLARPGFAVEHVEAFDADEALVLAAERHPERERPRVAFLSVPTRDGR